MSVVLDEETTTVVLEGLDFDVPCARQQVEGHAASHSLTCRRCGEVVFVCSMHMREVDDFILHGWVLTCRGCGSETRVAIAALYVVVPL